MPLVLVDTKREKFFKEMQDRRIIRKAIKPNAYLPRRAGLYLMRKDDADDDDFDDFLNRAIHRGRIGFYFDEANEVPAGRNSGIRRILRTGRSKRVPVIACSQRPVEIDHYFFTEAKHLCVMYLIDTEDRRTVRRYAPIDIDEELPRYHSLWYNNDQRELYHLAPVPPAETILEDMATRAPRTYWGR
jgi:hypothetical protein